MLTVCQWLIRYRTTAIQNACLAPTLCRRKKKTFTNNTTLNSHTDVKCLGCFLRRLIRNYIWNKAIKSILQVCKISSKLIIQILKEKIRWLTGHRSNRFSTTYCQERGNLIRFLNIIMIHIYILRRIYVSFLETMVLECLTVSPQVVTFDFHQKDTICYSVFSMKH